MHALILLLPLSLCQTDDAQRIDQVRRFMQSAVDTIRTAEVTYISENSGVGLSKDDLDFLKRAYRKYPNQLQGAARVMEVNQRERKERVSLTIDVDAGIWRMSTQDLRNLDQIMASESIAPSRRGFVDTSSELLASGDISARLRVGIPLLDVNTRQPEAAIPAVLASHLHIGAIWDDQFRRAAKITIVACGTQQLCLTLEDRDGGKRVLQVDPAIEYRYRILESYNSAGELVAKTSADDYHTVDGVRLPFIVQRTQYEHGGTVNEHQTIIVQEAHFNRSLSPGALALHIPPQTRVAGRNEEPMEIAQTLRIEELRTLYGTRQGVTSRPATR